MLRWKQTIKTSCMLVLALLSLPAVAMAAAQSSSANYQVNQVFFGSGGQLNACSANYCSKQSAGATAVGNTSSANYQAQAGFNTDRDNYLQLVVNTANINLGYLTPGTTATATASFSVKSYLSSGYNVTNASPPPANGSYTINTMTTPSLSNSNNEQFGINLVANQTSCANPAPANFGANPVQVPDSTFSYGTAATGYNTCGLFKYVNGDVIASSAQSSGETDYTISYIFNTTPTTPGGTYTFNHVLVATASF